MIIYFQQSSTTEKFQPALPRYEDDLFGSTSGSCNAHQVYVSIPVVTTVLGHYPEQIPSAPSHHQADANYLCLLPLVSTQQLQDHLDKCQGYLRKTPLLMIFSPFCFQGFGFFHYALDCIIWQELALSRSNCFLN